MHKYVSQYFLFIYNVHSYMFRHLCVILREFQNLCLAKLRKFLKSMLLKLQFNKIIRLNYIKILFGHRWKCVWHYNIVCKQCVYVAVHTMLVCWSGMLYIFVH
jgi:hypothetical protein